MLLHTCIKFIKLLDLKQNFYYPYSIFIYRLMIKHPLAPVLKCTRMDKIYLVYTVRVHIFCRGIDDNEDCQSIQSRAWLAYGSLLIGYRENFQRILHCWSPDLIAQEVISKHITTKDQCTVHYTIIIKTSYLLLISH